FGHPARAPPGARASTSSDRSTAASAASFNPVSLQTAKVVLYHTTRRRRLSSITRAPLPQGDGSPRSALAGGKEGGKRDLIVLDAGDVLDDAFPVSGPGIDAEGEVSSRCGHLRLLLPDLLRTSRNSLGPLRSRRLRRCRSSSVADGSLRRSISW